ncbi:hypothetical protein Back11_22720 [Paenibacillus baekrokdamisoli]|uniref:Uncharacterized protein n=1 Tax=Paenibacillus baekrokdamisoli TaxID=1712516 RepID=A0A3G9IPY1_9BACL|nr:hypothetical protein Back11_22720 [Paenibacillus baekrokdamisoli]
MALALKIVYFAKISRFRLFFSFSVTFYLLLRFINFISDIMTTSGQTIRYTHLLEGRFNIERERE